MDISKFHDRCVFICTEEEKIYKLLADNDIDDKIEDTTNFYKDGKLSQKIFKLKTLISDLEEYSEYFRDTSYRYKIIRIQGELKLLEILNNQCLHFSVIKKVLVNDIYKDLYNDESNEFINYLMKLDKEDIIDKKMYENEFYKIYLDILDCIKKEAEISEKTKRLKK